MVKLEGSSSFSKAFVDSSHDSFSKYLFRYLVLFSHTKPFHDIHWKGLLFYCICYVNTIIKTRFKKKKKVSWMLPALWQHKTSAELGYLANWKIFFFLYNFILSCLRIGKKQLRAVGWRAIERSIRKLYESSFLSLQTYSQD